MDPTLDIRGRQADNIRCILAEASRWEKVPNRREPLTWQMVHWVQQKAAQEESMGKQDNIYSVLTNWFTMGMQAGFRKSEWAQDSGLLKSSKEVAKNVDGSSKAFTLADFTFKGARGGSIPRLFPSSLNRAAMVDITWRFQKNKDNGQAITYAKDSNSPGDCFIAAAIAVVRRALRLKVAQDKPVAVYATHTKTSGDWEADKIHYVTDIEINKVLKEAAKAAHGITDPKDLQKYTSHSIRVGACVLLHVSGKSPDFIKFRLRWRSDSFRMYLRNLPALALQHVEAIQQAQEKSSSSDNESNSDIDSSVTENSES